MNKVRWGILSTAKIAREKVIPGMQAGKYCEIAAIASGNTERVQSEASRLHIPKVYNSYEALLADAEIDAVYIPLPNHLHVEWSIKAMDANKHVLCEKPIGLSSAEAHKLVEAASEKPHLKVMEAFMYRLHPQWQHAKKLVDEGLLGELRTIQSFFSYYNVDPGNFRNSKEAGGGGMMDIGCYCVSLSRFIFNREPGRVLGLVDYDPTFQVDRVASGILDFGPGTSNFTCSTQSAPYQRVNIIGSKARVEIDIPFNAPANKETRIWLHTSSGSEEIVFDAVDQYKIQGDLFSRAILENTAVPTDLSDAVNNMRVIEAIFESSETRGWKTIQ